MHLKKRLLFEKVLGNRGQIWVETVIYTLIAFSLMGIVLSFVIPKVEEIQDKGVTEQSIGILREIDSLIQGLGGPGNQRVLELGVNKGFFTIDAINEKILFNLESKYQYSQPGENVTVGGIVINTETRDKINLLTMTLNYTGKYNLTYKDNDEEKILSQASVPYIISISDRGEDSQGNIIINIEVTG